MKEQVLAMLTKAGESYLSGEAMSARLGVSRAAVWKAVDALRQEGCDIESAPRQGYRLAAPPDRLTEGTVLPYIKSPAQREKLICLDSVDSTNNYAKSLAMAGDADSTAIAANGQTGGRGRQGRSFDSPRGKGVYLTMLYRPEVSPLRASTITSYVAVAVCDGIEAACGVRPGIKWTNDIVLDGRKLAGILTELAVEGESGALQYLITGIGVNANHAPADFPPEVAPVAVSLAEHLGYPVNRGRLCGEMINALGEMYPHWLAGTGDYFRRYRENCLTLGKPVRLLRPNGTREAFAEDIDQDFGLIVRYPDGTRETVTAGEVSVRGLFGYTE
ncbi:MAG: biotin--[acetyl-CoA-carboxylase] ligase [Oscillospiraceae bacterium]|nr:biotin--[acetyl-CoA-carboxylase] ligase [Oscillospiraceae bacterium]